MKSSIKHSQSDGREPTTQARCQAGCQRSRNTPSPRHLLRAAIALLRSWLATLNRSRWERPRACTARARWTLPSSGLRVPDARRVPQSKCERARASVPARARGVHNARACPQACGMQRRQLTNNANRISPAPAWARESRRQTCAPGLARIGPPACRAALVPGAAAQACQRKPPLSRGSSFSRDSHSLESHHPPE